MPSVKWRSFCLDSQKQLSNLTSSYWIPELFMEDNWKKKKKEKKRTRTKKPQNKSNKKQQQQQQHKTNKHFNDVIMSAMAFHNTNLTIVKFTQPFIQA